MRQIILDTETTGLSAAAGDRIIEIGCVELINRRLTGHNFHHYFNPDRESHEDALKIHGLTKEFLQDKPRFEQVCTEFLDYVRDAEIIIHNAPFDVGFLNAELGRLNQAPFTSHILGVIDSLALAKQLYPGKRNSLDALCDRLGVDRSARTLHGALLDAELLADIYLALTRGQEALIDESELIRESIAQKIDFNGFKFVVIQPNQQELAEHEAILNELDKASGGQTLWRKVLNSDQPDVSKSTVA